jgi:hypothetical protein
MSKITLKEIGKIGILVSVVGVYLRVNSDEAKVTAANQCQYSRF